MVETAGMVGTVTITVAGTVDGKIVSGTITIVGYPGMV